MFFIQNCQMTKSYYIFHFAFWSNWLLIMISLTNTSVKPPGNSLLVFFETSAYNIHFFFIRNLLFSYKICPQITCLPTNLLDSRQALTNGLLYTAYPQNLIPLDNNAFVGDFDVFDDAWSCTL